jgi:hypothetical protein
MAIEEYRRKFPSRPVTCREVRLQESIFQAKRYQALGQHWSKKRVIRSIRARRSAGRALNRAVVGVEDDKLLEAGLRYFGSWDGALRASGSNPEEVRKWSRWTPDLFRRRIGRLQERGVPLSWSAVRRRDRKLMKVAYSRYGSWTKALRAFGKVPQFDHERWTRAKVVREILERQRRGEPLHARHLMLNGAGFLYGAARSKFGTWGKALRAAGIAPATVHRRRSWTKATVLRAIRAACSKRTKPFGLEDEDPGLVAAARKFFGGWYEALRASGVWSPSNRSGYRWTKEELAAALRRRIRQGHPMRPTDVKKDANDLYLASRKLFGSLHAAAQAAGYPNAVPPPRRR